MICPNCAANVEDGASFCDRCGGATSNTRSDPLIGQIFHNEYRILRKLGEGGFGAVYEAEQTSFGRKVAIKTLHKHLSTAPSVVARFRREGVAASRLEHPSAIKILSSGQTEDGTLWISMEFLDGKTLRDHMRERGPMPPSELVGLYSSLCEVLEEAHTKGIVHRDLKPENIMILPLTGGRSLVKVLDFGIASLVEDPSVTKTGVISGTPAYMSPEQWKGLRHTDARSDIYSLGIIAYQCLSGRLPFEADSAPEWLSKHCFEPPKPLQDLIGGEQVPASLISVVMRSIEKEPSQRQASALELKGQLERALHGEEPPAPPPLAAAPTRSLAPQPSDAQSLPKGGDPNLSKGGAPNLSKGGAPSLSRGSLFFGLGAAVLGAGALVTWLLWPSLEDRRLACQRSEEKSCQIACEAKIAESCLKLGHMYYMGMGAVQDMKQGTQLYQRACDLGSFEACMDVSGFYTMGMPMFGISADPPRASALQQLFYASRECEQNLPLSCALIGKVYSEGKFVEKNEGLAKTYYQRACTLGEKSYCTTP